MKPEWWGSLLVQEKYQEEKACDKRYPYNNNNNNNNNNNSSSSSSSSSSNDDDDDDDNVCVCVCVLDNNAWEKVQNFNFSFHLFSIP